MGLDMSFIKAAMGLESATLDVELMKGVYVQEAHNSKKIMGKSNKDRESGSTLSGVAMAKANYESATKAPHCHYGRSKGLQTLWNTPLQQVQATMGNDHQGPGDLCTVGRHL